MRRVSSLLRPATGAVALALLAGPAGAAVTVSVEQHEFVVSGTTANEVVRYMNSHALTGDHGHAYANIHPDYQLSLTTSESGGICRPSQVDVHIDFDLTLPVAADASEMRGRTRWAWNGFTQFACSHEAHHQSSYTACASGFVAEAWRQSASECFELESDIREMLRDMRRDCELKQVPFDRQQSRVLAGLSIFAMARYERR